MGSSGTATKPRFVSKAGFFRKVVDVETWFGWCPRCACYKSRDQVNIHEGCKFQALEGSGEGEVLSLRNQSLES